MPRIGGQTVPTKLILLMLFDSVAILLSLYAAMYFRYTEAGWDPTVDSSILLRFGLVVLICELSLYFNDLYLFEVVRHRTSLLVHLIHAIGITCLILAFLYYVVPDLQLGRGVTLFASPLILVLILSWRLSLDASGLLARTSERILIVGTATTGVNLVRAIVAHPEFNLKVVGFLDETGQNVGKPLVNPGIIGSVGELEAIVRREKVDQVVLALAERRGTTPARALMRLKFAGVLIEDAHSLHEQLMGTIVLDNLSPSWLILSEGFRKSPILMVAKRAIDLVSAIVLLLLVWPVLLVAAVAIRLETPGPVFFRQTRVGLGGHSFQVCKFRSMYVNAEANGPQWATENDKRITRVGKFLRKYRIDEFPQLFNVLRGEMSLVGPRPERPEFTQMLEQEISFYGLRHTVRPGVTGWAQVKYSYGSTIEDAKRKLELDLFYIKHLDITLDLAIIFETIKVVLLGRGSK